MNDDVSEVTSWNMYLWGYNCTESWKNTSWKCGNLTNLMKNPTEILSFNPCESYFSRHCKNWDAFLIGSELNVTCQKSMTQLDAEAAGFWRINSWWQFQNTSETVTRNCHALQTRVTLFSTIASMYEDLMGLLAKLTSWIVCRCQVFSWIL